MRGFNADTLWLVYAADIGYRASVSAFRRAV